MKLSEIEKLHPSRCRIAWMRLAALALVASLVAAGSGCTMAVSVGAKLVGSAVDDADVKKKSEKLIGTDLAAADECL